ncbi:hypothetical protein DEJ23_11485 [Curtobacterium sp. MCSS17_008]|nr:hypothetical protein DEJ23_11485 [Curtobacterium sp. MCSS17_008]
MPRRRSGFVMPNASAGRTSRARHQTTPATTTVIAIAGPGLMTWYTAVARAPTAPTCRALDAAASPMSTDPRKNPIRVSTSTVPKAMVTVASG